MRSRIIYKRIRKAGCVFLGAVLLLFSFLPPARAETDLTGYITGAFAGRAAHAAKGKDLLSDADFLRLNAGTGIGDWAAFAMARYSTVDAAGKTVYYYGGDYAASTHLANWIAVTNVFPNSREAAHSNYENNTLLKALGG